MRIKEAISGKQGKHAMLWVDRTDEPAGGYFKAVEDFVYLTYKEWRALTTACHCTQEV